MLAGPVATATIAYAEAYSGLTRRNREGGLSASQYARTCERFERDWQEFVKVELQNEILLRARILIQRHALWGFDAIHLASAQMLEAGVEQAVTMVAADERLLRAAAGEGLATLNIETGRATPHASR